MASSSSADTVPPQRRVGLIYDERMCSHATPNGEDHPECPDRIRVIWKKLQTSGLVDRCVVLDAKAAEEKYIRLVHSKSHVELIQNISSKPSDGMRNRIANRFNSIYFNKGSTEAAYLAVGSVIEAVEKVARGDLSSSFAIVRPPGHHAEAKQPMGFCLFNNVGIAASYILNERPELGINRILVVDWDVHHGNGTQNRFWEDSRVLFFSVHRHEFGSFYPCTDDGSHTMIGEGQGAGYNINVPWEHARVGDSDYLAVWDHILIPVAREFKPDMIIVSAGFDAAIHDPLGGCHITPYGYSVMLTKLMEFAEGRIVLALEGGYNLNSLAKSAEACVRVLLDGQPIAGSAEAYPFASTWSIIKTVRQTLSTHWPILTDEIPKTLTSLTAPPPQLDLSSDSESEKPNESVDNIIEYFSELQVDGSLGQSNGGSYIWRSQLKTIDVWYASFGSNMWKDRFLCYIKGGLVEGMQRACIGSMDKNPPKEILWKTIPHRLLFGRDYTRTWGPGGVAFLHPVQSIEDKSYICMYRITLEQFNDVLYQENATSYETSSPLIDAEALNDISKRGYVSLDNIKPAWYHNVVYLGEEHGVPILTMTCDISAIEDFKSGKLPACGPAKSYANTLIRGLVEGQQLSETEARSYIEEAGRKPL